MAFLSSLIPKTKNYRYQISNNIYYQLDLFQSIHNNSHRPPPPDCYPGVYLLPPREYLYQLSPFLLVSSRSHTYPYPQHGLFLLLLLLILCSCCWWWCCCITHTNAPLGTRTKGQCHHTPRLYAFECIPRFSACARHCFRCQASTPTSSCAPTCPLATEGSR